MANVHEWIGQRNTPFNTWYIQFLGGGNSLDDCELHFLLHGMDSLTTAYCTLTGKGLGLPLGPRGFVKIPRTSRDMGDLISGEIQNDFEQIQDQAMLEGQLAKPFLDQHAQSNVWSQCFNLSQEKQFMTRQKPMPFSLADLDGAETEVEVVSSSFLVFQMISMEFSFPTDEGDRFSRANMGSAEANLTMPGHTAGVYNCKWRIQHWNNNFYSRCPFRKDGDKHRFSTNRFLHYLPPYTGYLFRTRQEYLAHYPEQNYPYWQDIFPQLNESAEHFLDNAWAGSVGGWAGDLPQSYIQEYGPSNE